MDKLKKLKYERKILRSSFTKCYNKLKKGEEDNVIVVKRQIIDKFQRIEAADKIINELIRENQEEDYEEDIEKEINEQEQYRENYIEIMNTDEGQYKENKDEEKQVSGESCGIKVGGSNSKLRLPMIQLFQYDGKPRSWLSFWSQFSLIDGDASIRREDKYQYLLSSLKEGSKPRLLVEKFQPIGYAAAVQHLKTRFGNPDILIETYVRDLIKLVVSQNHAQISVLYDQIESYLRALEVLGIEKKTFSPVLYPLIESCLPKEYILNWERWRNLKAAPSPGFHADDDDNASIVSVFSESKLELLMEFLRSEAEGEERAKLAK